MLRILQISDLHIYSDPTERLLGQNTRSTLISVVDLAKRVYWPVDRILLTGDLVHDENPQGYHFIVDVFSRLGIPCNGLPGNHDIPSLMSETLQDSVIKTEAGVLCDAWNLVFLDSTIQEEAGGHLSATQLDLLQTHLSAHPRHHALVCLHHQPVPVGSQWMDTMALDNPEEFFAIIDANPQVRGIVWGHIHQAFDSERNGVALLGVPSTCIQFLPGSDDFAIDSLTPGFRWLNLHPDGRIETGIERIDAYPSPIDLTSEGY